MPWSINFTDGTYFNIVGTDNMAAFDTVGFSNCILSMTNGDNQLRTLWTGSKTDLDGRKWEINNDGIVTYHSPIGDITINLMGWRTYQAICAFYQPSSSTNGFYMDRYERQSRSVYFDGSDGSAMSWEQANAEYPNGRKVNFISNNLSVAYYSGDTEGVKGFGGTLFNFEWFTNSLKKIDEETDPYSPGGSSGTGGGTGNFDGTGDNISIPGLPTLSAVDTGFITLFNPSISQLKSLSDYMWSGVFDIDTFKKIFANPMDCILGLSIVPVSVPNGELKEVSVGNIPTGISMTVAASQYVIVDCGTLNVNEFWGAYLDYDPYTKAEIYLPYIGTHPISVDDIMGKSVHVVYHVDILSGACTAFVKCGGSVLYEFIGQCSSSIPVTGNDWTNVINGVLSVSAAIGTMVATGGATAPMAATAIASTAVNSLKSNVEKSGAMSGTGGMLAVQTPYLILTRPRQAMPARQNEFMGYPSFITSKLDSLSGYTVVEEIHLENISGTEQEISEIENLLKTGVIL